MRASFSLVLWESEPMFPAFRATGRIKNVARKGTDALQLFLTSDSPAGVAVTKIT